MLLLFRLLWQATGLKMCPLIVASYQRKENDRLLWQATGLNTNITI